MKATFSNKGKKLPAYLTLFIIFALVLQACGGGATQPPAATEAAPVEVTEPVAAPETEAPLPETEPPAATEAPAETEAQAETEAPVEPAAEREGVLRVAMQPIVNTDPAAIQSDSEILIANHVYDYLVDVDAQNNLIPRLATDWEVSDDGLTYVFTLAEGVTFHDGSPLTAEDVVWTFNRLRDPESGFPTVDLYANIADIQATGDLEVTFTLTQTNPFFLYDLSDNHALVLKADTEDPTQFNGTGPFVVANYSPEDRIELTANESYFVPGQPRLAGFEIIFFSDDTAMADALRGGQVDLMMRIPTPLYESLRNEPSLEAISIPTNSFDLIRLRTDRAPGNIPEVVQAFKLATDREAAFLQVEQGYGAIGRDSPIGPLYTQYYSEDTPIPARDPEQARELLAQAGYPDGLQMELHTTDTGNRPDLAVVLQAQWAEAGIDVEVVVEPESVYFADNGWLEVDLGITNWGTRPYPQFYLDTMIKCNAIWNEAHFCDEEVDQLIETAGTTLDEEERVQAYQDIQRILIERGPFIITSFWAMNSAINNQFQGFEPKAFAGRTDFREVSLAE